LPVSRGLWKGNKHFRCPVLPEAEHALRYRARSIVKAHKGEEWTDRSLADCIDEAITFDAAVKDPERITDLASFFWPEIQHATGTDLDAINARREAARDKAEAERERLAYEKLIRAAGDKLRDGDLPAAKENWDWTRWSTTQTLPSSSSPSKCRGGTCSRAFGVASPVSTGRRSSSAPVASGRTLRRRPEIDESGRIVMSGGDSQRAERCILWVHDR
jgi:hypothetical protein